jgi:hypothetical protein
MVACSAAAPGPRTEVQTHTSEAPVHAPARLVPAALAALGLTAGLLAAAAAPAAAANSTGCEGGAFTVTLPSGRTVASGDQRVDSRGLTGASLLKVRGRYVEFDYAPTTGAVTNYVYTGAANPLSMTPGVRTPVWASKTLDRGPGTKGRTELQFAGEHVRLITSGATKVKVQAKDCATGGVFQQEAETESGAATVATHTLAAGMYYYVNPYTGKLNVGNGAGFVAKDSAQVAQRLSQTAAVSVWQIASGGRMGFVSGEDAVELGSGPTTCVQDCQAQNRVRGSLPVTDPAFQDINSDAFVPLGTAGGEHEDD